MYPPLPPQIFYAPLPPSLPQEKQQSRRSLPIPRRKRKAVETPPIESESPEAKKAKTEESMICRMLHFLCTYLCIAVVSKILQKLAWIPNINACVKNTLNVVT